MWAALAGAAAAQPLATFQPQLARDTNPAMASFADVYRMTVGTQESLSFDETAKAQVASEAALRVSSSPTPVVSELQFRVAPAREPERWLMILSGLALAGWVAHRRLVNWI